MIRSIVVGTDGSDTAAEAVRQATELAKSVGARVYLVCAYEAVPERRLRTERTGSDKGVGLGLSIVRSVARAHGGHIYAQPREGGGLVMRVTLPI